MPTIGHFKLRGACILVDILHMYKYAFSGREAHTFNITIIVAFGRIDGNGHLAAVTRAEPSSLCYTRKKLGTMSKGVYLAQDPANFAQPPFSRVYYVHAAARSAAPCRHEYLRLSSLPNAFRLSADVRPGRAHISKQKEATFRNLRSKGVIWHKRHGWWDGNTSPALQLRLSTRVKACVY